MIRPYRIVSTTLHTQEVFTRIPFRYGIVTMTQLPHVFLEVRLEGDKGQSRGLSADHLPPKWFTKDPNAAIDDEIATMREVIVHAASLVTGVSFQSVFQLWRELWTAQATWAEQKGYPPLLAQFGTSLVERAIIDAFCRLEDITLSTAIHTNRFAIDFHSIDPTLPSDWTRLLPAKPLNTVVARHTVGMVDQINESDPAATNGGPTDTLPSSLERAIHAYQLREFKIKFCGVWEQDEPRLAAVFACLAQHAHPEWRYSLDGNESFADAGAFRDYWARLTSASWMRPHLGRLLFVEQPVNRKVALSASADWRSWAAAPKITIDESDGGLDDVPTSLKLGYAGSTHKNCKGVFKGILNRCRLLVAASQGRSMMMSGEDLSNIGPVALLQDLAVQALLGNRSVERNGHHYFRGLSMWPESVQRSVVEAHPDLFDDSREYAALTIRDGSVQLDSVIAAPFGYGLELDPRTFCASTEEIAAS
ncbi:MAG: hypothetical protein ABIZ04_26885 [Opitutus sp.]